MEHLSPVESDGVSVSMDKSMSTSSSLRTPEFEYLDNNEIASFDSLVISDSEHTVEAPAIECKTDMTLEMVSYDETVYVGDNIIITDPQEWETIACDVHKHLRASEAKKRPSADFMERVQKDINANMRAKLIDWLVAVAEDYRLVPETLYLAVNYIDRYLSGNVIDRDRLPLLGIACMMIASKYEEICAPSVEKFCILTSNTYSKDEVLQMESAVLNYLKFEMTVPTTKSFLQRFARAAAEGLVAHDNAHESQQLEFLSDYIAELSLAEYSMLCYAPSIVAASSIFLAKYSLLPSGRPWNSTLLHYTQYQPLDLRDCVMVLHSLCYKSHNISSLPAIRDKYNQHKYKFVAKMYCPPSIPPEFFENVISS